VSADKDTGMKLVPFRAQLTERRYLFGVKVNGGGFLSEGGRVYALDGDWIVQHGRKRSRSSMFSGGGE